VLETNFFYSDSGDHFFDDLFFYVFQTIYSFFSQRAQLHACVHEPELRYRDPHDPGWCIFVNFLRKSVFFFFFHFFRI
jgi:hypothetical protein